MNTSTIAPEAKVSQVKRAARPAGSRKPETKQEFVTVDQFDKMTDLMKGLVEAVTELKSRPATPQAAETQEVAKAKADAAPINPAWEDKAREIIGEAVDHCEVFYPKAGGQIFTIVIKTEFSNASADYMQRMKTDRRSREIGNEGIGGVEIWAKLVKQNLKRGSK